eukprot:TRINITY_DN83260_c0_g1_i1.p1 TRINITY_DN83260_c0_g1~~TRINITY_DN83260_c0_g1_i1.p1  ORF type:complete len:398 (+),score=108.85 TRINITY_DN83260_c0_g1_i1:403-1596(+)
MHHAKATASTALGSESMIIDIGPALLKAKETVNEGDEACTTCGIREAHRGPLTTSHIAVRHLDVCEAKHVWRWVPDQKLSQLWRDLSVEERARVVETHAGGQAVRRFCKEMAEHVRPKDCRASEKAKRSLGAVFMLDQHSLSIYKEMFVVAVEQNVPLAINMQVIEAVDGVVQDFCAARRQHEGRQIGYLDPRTFPEGSDLWVQYREREHVRLMWMSTMAKVFEIRLLQLWEGRYGAVEREAARQASLQAAMELLALEELEQSKGKKGGNAAACEAEIGSGAKERRKRQRQRKKAAAKEASAELHAAEARASKGDMDEIDTEFNRRVLEHLRVRAEEAKKTGAQPQTDRGNAILKALCKKLKAQLEEVDEGGDDGSGGAAGGDNVSKDEATRATNGA